MKNKALHLRISERRLNKLREYAASRDKTMTSIIEDWIDSLPQNPLPAIHLNTEFFEYGVSLLAEEGKSSSTDSDGST